MMNKNLYGHILKVLKSGKRFDGRGLTDYRKISVETGVTKTAEGSALVRIGETEVMAGVKLEVSKPYPDTPDKGTIIVGAELLPLSSPEFETGPPGIKAIELARVVDRGVRESGFLDFKKMCIEEGEKVWTALIDVCSMNDAGNLMDACYLAAFAALKDVRLPKFDGEKLDYKEKTSKKLPLSADDPISVTVVKIGEHILIDPTIEEGKVIDARITVNSKKDGTRCALQKGGETPLMPEGIVEMVDLAGDKSKELRGAIK
jgi:exosome complex component RRP42